MAQAFSIGIFFNAMVGLNENILMYYHETDGITDAYWTCLSAQGDPRQWEGNISLASW